MIDRLARFFLVRRLQHSFYGWNPAQLERHHRKRLKAILRVVMRRSAYYRNLRQTGWDGQFASLPLMSKGEMVDHFDEINTAGLRQSELFAFAAGQQKGEQSGLFQGKYSVGLSSGTSGTRLPTVLNPAERWQYGSLLFARSGIPATVQHPRVLFLLRVNNPAFNEVRFLGVQMIYSDYNKRPDELVQIINEKQLNVLAGPPSLLRMLARLRARVRVPIQALISYAEVLDDATRDELVAAFDAPIAQIYQGAEGFIASTCRMGNLHLNEDVVYVEALDAGDPTQQARRVIVTDLYRATLPFIRYQLNDILELAGPGDPRCPCGSCFRLVKRIHGRADDVFYLRARDGQIRCLFPDYVVRSINQASDDILEFQAIQHAPERIEIRLEMKPGADRPRIEQQIRANLSGWAARLEADLGEILFSEALPERNPGSFKLIRVTRKYHEHD